MAAQTIELIPLQNLRIDLFNPRHEQQASQREAISNIAHDQGMKLVNLAEDIIDKGLNPSDLPIVAVAEQEAEGEEEPRGEQQEPDEQMEMYTVLEV